jgi:translation initiation factor eIF-2B subunit alpha
LPTARITLLPALAAVQRASQQDLPLEHKPVDVGPLLPRSVAVYNPSRDYTPPAYINLLVTDLGVLTPAAVSDELIQLYV